jgi:predicted lipid carrier protein YhbT
VSNSVRWTEEQLANFKRRRETLTVSEPIQLVPQPEKVSKIERRFDQQLVENDVPLYQRNYFFLPDRDLELDFAWPALKVAVEVQGMAIASRASSSATSRSGRSRCWQAGACSRSTAAR